MRLKRFVFAAFFSVMLPGALPVFSAPISAPILGPHRAIYDLVLDKATDRSGITALAGRMIYEFNGSACEGYTVSFRFVTKISTNDVSRMTDQRATTFEGGDGKVFDFVTKVFVEGNLDSEVKGVARREPAGVSVKLERPEKQKLDLEDTRFPTQHLIEIIENARAGKTFYETTLFDGSEDADRVMTTTVVIGRKAEPAAGDVELGVMNEFARDPYWPVEIAYFAPGDGDSGEMLPEYRISFKLHDNGVTRDLLMDYGEFAMRGKLVNLSLLEAPKPCE